MPISRMPSATDARVMPTRSIIPPRTRAVRARSNTLKLSALSSGSPSTPARRNTATNASRPATAHTTVCTRRTGMPSIAARSPSSALARTATPIELNRRPAASSAMAMGATTSAITSLALNRTLDSPEPTLSVRSNGGAIRALVMRSMPHKPGEHQRAEREELGQPDGRDGEQQAGRLGEPADDDEVDQRTEAQGGDDADDHGDGVGPLPHRQEQERQDDRHRAQVALGEAHDAVRSVRQRHAERDKCGEPTDDDAAEEEPRRHREGDELQRDHRGRGPERTGDAPPIEAAEGRPMCWPNDGLLRGQAHPPVALWCCWSRSLP